MGGEKEGGRGREREGGKERERRREGVRERRERQKGGGSQKRKLPPHLPPWGRGL